MRLYESSGKPRLLSHYHSQIFHWHPNLNLVVSNEFMVVTNHYLSIREQIPTFHADNVIAGDTGWIEAAYIEHLDTHFGAAASVV